MSLYSTRFAAVDVCRSIPKIRVINFTQSVGLDITIKLGFEFIVLLFVRTVMHKYVSFN